MDLHEKNTPANEWRAKLTEMAKATADKAEAEGRTQFTSDEDAHMGGIIAEFCRALIVQKSSEGGAGK
jgi:hypothetical protein